jgi:hypothetical protein
MAKLNQLIACLPKVKFDTKEKMGEVYKKIQQTKLLSGISRTYNPKNETGEKYPDERQLVQYSVPEAIKDFSEAQTELLDTVYSQDATNALAFANLVIDGKTVLEQVPVTYLLFLEKQAENLLTFARTLPTLDLAQQWEQDGDLYKSKPTDTFKTKKVYRNHVKAAATDKHPAQVEVYTEDEREGTWTKVDFSGAIPVKDRKEIEARAMKLLAAVKTAREEANLAEIKKEKVGDKLLNYVFQG